MSLLRLLLLKSGGGGAKTIFFNIWTDFATALDQTQVNYPPQDNILTTFSEGTIDTRTKTPNIVTTYNEGTL